MICIAGKNNVAVDSTMYLLDEYGISEKELLILPNDSDSGCDGWQKSLKKLALDKKLTIVNLEDIYKEKNLLFISLEYNKIIDVHKFESKRLYNIHFSLLPKYKGMYTSMLPILHGELFSGVTLHEIDSGIDTGNIIAQLKFEIDINDTSRDLYMKYNTKAVELFKENISNLINDNFVSYPQPNIKSTYYSKNSVNFKKIEIDFRKTSYEIHNQIRSYIFTEYQLPDINGYKITKTYLTKEKSDIPNCIIDRGKYFEITGIDRYIILAFKEN